MTTTTETAKAMANSIQITKTDDDGFPLESIAERVKGLHWSVSDSRFIQCLSRQRGHQLPITDCDCLLCKDLNTKALQMGIGFDLVWRPDEPRADNHPHDVTGP